MPKVWALRRSVCPEFTLLKIRIETVYVLVNICHRQHVYGSSLVLMDRPLKGNYKPCLGVTSVDASF